MDKYLQYFAAIIEEASKGRLGITALIVIALSVLIYSFCRNERPKIKIPVLLIFILGCSALLVVENIPEESSTSSKEAAFLLFLGDQSYLSGDIDAARERYQHAVTLYEAGNEPDALATTYLKLGQLELDNDRLEVASDYYLSAETYFTESKNLIGLNEVKSAYNIINSGGIDAYRRRDVPETEIARSKTELAAYLVHHTQLNGGEAEEAVDNFFESIIKTLKAGYEVRVVGFGTFSVAHRQASEGRNPRTGERIQIPESNQPKFKAGAALKKAVNDS